MAEAFFRLAAALPELTVPLVVLVLDLLLFRALADLAADLKFLRRLWSSAVEGGGWASNGLLSP